MADSATLFSSPKTTPSKIIENLLLKTPKKRNGSYRSNSPSPKKIKFSNSDPDDSILADIKSEFYDTNILTEGDAIDLVHDLDSIIYCNEYNESNEMLSLKQDILENIENSISYINKDPIKDPLLIDSSDEKKIASFKMEDSSMTIPPRINLLRKYKKLKTAEKPNSKSSIQKKIFQEIEKVKEKQNLSTTDKDALLNIKINLVHKVPPQHRLKGPRSITLTKEQVERFKKYGPLKIGAYSDMEDEIIKRNWSLFCKNHNWNNNNVYPFLRWKHNNANILIHQNERIKFLQFLANGLPWRAIYSVYRRFRQLYTEKNTDSYTAEEDKKIITHMESFNITGRDPKFQELSLILRRSKASIYRRYNVLRRQNLEENSVSTSEVTWTIKKIEMYIRTLLKLTLSTNIQELKDARIPKVVWNKMEEQLSIDWKILRKLWVYQLHLQLYCSRPIYLNDIKIQLIEYMYGTGITSMKEIIWPKILQYFNGMTTLFLCDVFSHIVNDCPIKSSANNLFDILEYLYENKIPQLRDEKFDKNLPRLKYSNGRITIINDNKKNK
ncbi:uncharacterized protein [Prorops nasuta]|uniref:uncharacterized protein n=1 Tax=Prorops nasuta TaxID=863751 RepID=UPI0034CE4AC9